MGHYSEFYDAEKDTAQLRAHPAPKTWRFPMQYIQKAEVAPKISSRDADAYLLQLPRDLQVELSRGIEAQKELNRMQSILVQFRSLLRGVDGRI